MQQKAVIFRSMAKINFRLLRTLKPFLEARGSKEAGKYRFCHKRRSAGQRSRIQNRRGIVQLLAQIGS